MTGFGTETELLADGTSLVAITGELDIDTADQFESELAGAIANSTGAVVIDLSACDFLDSSALTVLIRAGRKLADADRDLSLVASSANILRVFQITGLDRAFSIHPTRAAVLPPPATGTARVARRPRSTER